MKTKHTPFLRTLVTAGLAVATWATAINWAGGQTVTITYGSGAGDLPDITSDASMVTAEWVLELGYFLNGFNSGDTPINLWTDSWVALGSTPFREAPFNNFQANYNLVNGSAPNQPGWLWLHNNGESGPQGASEWAIFRDAEWHLNDPSEPATADWKVFQIDDPEILVGGIDNLRFQPQIATKGIIYVAGEDAAFEIQSASVPPTVIPEPASSLLILVGLATLFLRRRRSHHGLSR